MQEYVGASRSAAGLNLPLLVKRRLAAAIHYDKLCIPIEASIAGAEHNIICSIRPEKFPGSFEQLEEFPDDNVVRRICKYAYHDEIL